MGHSNDFPATQHTEEFNATHNTVPGKITRACICVDEHISKVVIKHIKTTNFNDAVASSYLYIDRYIVISLNE